jgi:hypothetical protein
VNARTDNPIERPADTPRLNALLDRHEAETKDMDNREWLRHSVIQVREILAHARELERERNFWERDSMNAHAGANRLGDQRDDARRALQGLLDHYVGLVNSGDAGNWDPETEPVVIEARRCLPATPEGGQRE